MRRRYALILPLLMFVACDDKATPPAQPEAPVAEQPALPSAKAAHDDHGAHGAAVGHAEKVKLTAGGTTFDPPVEVAEIPAGAYMCDMGTVHYARMEKKADPCPVCGMALVRKEAGGEVGSDTHGH